eukprot:g5065.t1
MQTTRLRLGRRRSRRWATSERRRRNHLLQAKHPRHLLHPRPLPARVRRALPHANYKSGRTASGCAATEDGKLPQPKPPNRREQVEAAASEVRGLTHYKEDWNAEVRAKFQAGLPDGEELFTFEEYDSWAVSSYYSKELNTEEKAKRRHLNMFVKYHLIPKVVGPVDTASPFPGWTLFAGPDDDPDDDDFYQDEVVVEERAGEKKQAGEKGKDKGSGKEEDKEQAGEKGKDKAEEEESDGEGGKEEKKQGEGKKKGRGTGGEEENKEGEGGGDQPAQEGEKEAKQEGMEDVWYETRTYMLAQLQSSTVDEYPEVSFAFEKRHDRRSLLRVLQKVWYHMSQVVTKPNRASSAAEQRALQVPVQATLRAVSRPSHRTGLVPCAKASCENKLKLHDQFCCKCGAVAPKNLLVAAAGLGPRVWDAEPPLDPAWDREWKVNPVQQNDRLWYYGTVTTAPEKKDGLVALYCVVLGAPEQKYRSGKGKYKVPWFQAVVEVMEMRVSKEIPRDFQVRGVTPKPEVARAWDGSKSPEANHKLVVDRVSIPELIKAWKTKSRIIMLFNIATYRRGVTSYVHANQPVEWDTNGRLNTRISSFFPPGEKIYYKAQDRVWTDDEEEEDEEAAAANE